MIIETIFSTVDEVGNPNFAPMGITWGAESIGVRPFRSTQTYRNLLSSGYGVANLSDDVLAYVQCGLYDEILPFSPAVIVPGVVFKEACSWLELRVLSQSEIEERAEFQCSIVHKSRQRDFLGFCRAGNAVIEAAILATRLAFYDWDWIVNKLNHYMKIVEKTGDQAEKKAFQMVCDYVQEKKQR